MSNASFDTDAAHRWFAKSTNNAVWDWLDANTDGTAADPIVHAVHASYFHWDQVGTDLERARAASLAANVHSTLGNAAIAQQLAELCISLLDAAGDAGTDWDQAFALDSLARASAAARLPDAAKRRAEARAAGDAIADPDDKAVFDAWFTSGNWHGLG